MRTAKPITFTGTRGIIAQKMHENLSKTAQPNFFADVDASALVAARLGRKANGLKIGYESRLNTRRPFYADAEPSAAHDHRQRRDCRSCVMVDGAIVVRPIISLSLTVDHRVIEGAPAGAFLSALAPALEATG